MGNITKDFTNWPYQLKDVLWLKKHLNNLKKETTNKKDLKTINNCLNIVFIAENSFK